jgi:molecular chaperone HtpG
MQSEQKFQVDLRGIIDLLSHHLYTGPHVYVREVLQNAVDAITARMEVDSAHQGEIRLEILQSGKNPPTLIVQDNGIGLSASEVHQFLAVIGQSSKREALNRQDFIGQFGIGLLSCFMVCHEIVVITRSARGSHPAVEWRGRSDGTYAVRELEHGGEPGTQVYLRCKPGCEEFFEPEYVCRMARHYGALLPHSIQVVAGGEQWRINEQAPWRASHASSETRREVYLEYGRRVFNTEFLDAFPLVSDAGAVEGIAFVLPYSPSMAGKRSHRVYLKNMLLAEQAENLLPDWGFFVQCVINASDLRPTASREGFYEDETLTAARASLGECLRHYLLRLAREDRSRLDVLIGIHHLAMKALALDDEEAYRVFIEWLPFETSSGEMTLREYLADHPIVQYVRTRDQFRQIAGVAAAQSRCIINGGYTYDADLLERLPEIDGQRQVECLDGTDVAESLDDLTLDEQEAVFDFIRLADTALQPFQCSAQLKKFQPVQLPALYTTNDSATFLRSVEQSKEVADELWSSVLDQIADEPAALALSQLCLNYSNPLVRRLSAIAGRKLVQLTVKMLYVQALLMGHYPLKAKEMQLLNDGLLALIEQSLNAPSGDKP